MVQHCLIYNNIDQNIRLSSFFTAQTDCHYFQYNEIRIENSCTSLMAVASTKFKSLLTLSITTNYTLQQL